jgi:hypothetical protein
LHVRERSSATGAPKARPEGPSAKRGASQSCPGSHSTSRSAHGTPPAP